MCHSGFKKLAGTTATICLVALLTAVRCAHAQQTSWSISTAGDLTAALEGAFNNNVTNPSLVNTITLTGSIFGTSQWIVNANVNIVGSGYTIDMQNADRAFFIAGGNVAISNLTIQNGNATGGFAIGGGGAGAGLGGAVFVGSGTYFGGAPQGVPTLPIVAQGVSVPAVTLRGVTFFNNLAAGGYALTNLSGQGTPISGGGGGMGGSSGPATDNDSNGLGGGGFGNNATGGNNSAAGGPGAFVNIAALPGMSLSGGPGGNGSDANGTAGGVNGGGGGMGGYSSDPFLGVEGSGGGGGLGGARGYFVNGEGNNNGGNGGFGGGGGGGAAGPESSGGNGGFGGGGGAAPGGPRFFSGGSGGFGGGGGGADSTGLGAGGFGAGAGSVVVLDGGGGGGGLGAGGALFVMNGARLTIESGSFTNNTVVGGASEGIGGSAYGADLFLGSDVTFAPAQGVNVVLTSLGGAGHLADPNVASNANDPNANGGIIKTGAGTLTLTGTSYYSGITTVNSGTLTLAAGATEQGTTVVTVGQNPGDVATLVLGSSSTLTLGGFNGVSGSDLPLAIAQAAGSTGTVVIGNGAGSNGADIGARVFTGGPGNASVVFTQQYWAAGTNPVYPFLTSLTGSLGIVQAGLGTTSLQPLYGANTFAGPVTVDLGTLATTGTAAALAGATSIAVNAGGVLALGQADGVNDLAAITLAGGILQTATSLSETFGALSITNGASTIDFLGTASTLNFSTLSLGGSLAIWNYAGANDFLTIDSGTATGSLAQVQFFSDSGSTFLGWGGFEGTRLVPVAVPEPSTYCMALAGIACGGLSMWRRRKRA
jgi:hypothetical protein